jgi:hypothetical protein
MEEPGVSTPEARCRNAGAKDGELAGLQAWTIHGRKGERGCTMTLSKRGRGLLRWRTGERTDEREGS